MGRPKKGSKPTTIWLTARAIEKLEQEASKIAAKRPRYGDLISGLILYAPPELWSRVYEKTKLPLHEVELTWKEKMTKARIEATERDARENQRRLRGYDTDED